MSKYVIELNFKDDPSRLLKALGLRDRAFRKVKERILTRLASRPSLEMIVLEFRREGLFYGEVQYGDSKRYKQARKSRGEADQRANARRNQDRPEEREVDSDDGVSDASEDQTGWSLEQILRRTITRRGSERA